MALKWIEVHFQSLRMHFRHLSLSEMGRAAGQKGGCKESPAVEKKNGCARSRKRNHQTSQPFVLSQGNWKEMKVVFLPNYLITGY